MKRFSCILLIAVMFSLSLMSFAGCSKKNSKDDEDVVSEESLVEDRRDEEVSTDITQDIADSLDRRLIYVPELQQIQSIAELAVLETYYHNVARGMISAGTGIAHWGEQDTPFWVEYSAIVTYGIDFNEISMDIYGNDVIVHLPHARVIGDVTVVEGSVENPIYTPNGFWVNDVQIHASDITTAISEANAQILSSASTNTIAMNNAEARVQELVENYIAQIMQLSGVEYRVTFVYDEDVE